MCPAKGASICSGCCGAKRRVEIACPDSCAYLDGGHAPGWEGRRTERERDSRRVLPHVQSLSEAQRELFLAMLVGIRETAQKRRELDDRQLADALAALRKTTETRVRGVIYEHRPDDARAQALVAEMAGWLRGGEPTADGAAAPPDADQLAVLKALEATALGVMAEAAETRAFLEMVTRLTLGAVPAASPEPSPLVVIP